MMMTPLFLAIILWDTPHQFLLAAIVFSVAAITDAVDGKLARKRQEITVFGKLLDPVADKMLTTAALLAFMQLGWCSVWIVFIILTREFVVTSIRLIALSQGMVIPANIWGKLKTVSQMTFTIVIMLLAELDRMFDVFAKVVMVEFSLLTNILLGITAFFTVVSGIIYVVRSRKLIDYSK
jgi:CDP-diacylglycerol--glycerol-3-phosphate 3-phosphatidyltransferase